jgi:5-formyltetrahydrofolate cyclo-ligase
MKNKKIAEYIYSNPDSKTAEILTRALQQDRENFLDFVYNENEDILKFTYHLSGLNKPQFTQENLYDIITQNRENILKEFRELFLKK